VAAPFDRALRAAIDAETARVPGAALARAADALSRRYREAPPEGIGCLTDDERLAYAAVRLPATAAALDAVFAAVAAHTGLEPASITDLGAGPATVLWPALWRWPGIGRVTLIDRDPALLALGLRLWQHVGPGATPEIVTRTGDLTASDAPASDLVVVSYAIGEVDAGRVAAVVDRALALTRGAVAIVEPGTPAGYARILAVRDRLRAGGAVLAAPCPHHGTCPMAGTDWCHFAARLDRSRLHRYLKQGDLGWEDEKFSYVVAVPAAAAVPRRAAARIVRRPRKDTGHVRLPLCAADGLRDAIVTRRAADYRDARDAEWGDEWPPRRG
jgi:ribosomal protein RSM22 (predicted rRNA methylase)